MQYEFKELGLQGVQDLKYLLVQGECQSRVQARKYREWVRGTQASVLLGKKSVYGYFDRRDKPIAVVILDEDRQLEALRVSKEFRGECIGLQLLAKVVEKEVCV